MSRSDSSSSVTFNTTSMPVGSSRGPSPLTIGMSDTIPLAIAFTETVNAYFKGTDATRSALMHQSHHITDARLISRLIMIIHFIYCIEQLVTINNCMKSINIVLNKMYLRMFLSSFSVKKCVTNNLSLSKMQNYECLHTMI